MPAELQAVPSAPLAAAGSVTQEVGVSGGYLPFMTYNGEVLNEVPTYKPNDMLTMLRVDSQIRAIYRAVTLPIRAAMREFEVKPVDGDTGQAEFIHDVLSLPAHDGGMSSTLDAVLKQALLGIVTGFTAFELVYQVPTEGKLANKITIRKMAYRDPRTVTFRSDSRGSFKGITQRAAATQTAEVQIDPPYVWYWTSNEEENPFYGIPIFSSAFHLYEIKQKIYWLQNMGAQIRALGVKTAKHPAGVSSPVKDSVRRALEQVGANTVVLYPMDWEIDFKKIDGLDLVPYVDHLNAQMSKSVLADIIDNETRTVIIDASTNNGDLFAMSLQAIAQDVLTSWTQHVMPNLINWNFGPGFYPELVIPKLSEDLEAASLEIFKSLSAAASMQVTPEFWLNMEKSIATKLGYPIDYDELEEQMLEDKELDREVEKEVKTRTMEDAKNPPPPAPPAGGAPPKKLSDASREQLVALSDMIEDEIARLSSLAD